VAHPPAQGRVPKGPLEGPESRSNAKISPGRTYPPEGSKFVRERLLRCLGLATAPSCGNGVGCANECGSLFVSEVCLVRSPASICVSDS
jgi:hypothetical protein